MYDYHYSVKSSLTGKTWAMNGTWKCWSGGPWKWTHCSHPHSVLSPISLGSLADPSGLINSIYWGWYANFQDFSLCLRLLKAQLLFDGILQLWLFLQLLVLVGQLPQCEVHMPCKRCSCCRSRECLQTDLAFCMKETAKPNPEAFSHYSNCRPVITVLPVSSRPTPSEVGKKIHLEAGGFYSLTVLSPPWKLHKQLYRLCPFPSKYYLVILNFWSMLSSFKKKIFFKLILLKKDE